MLTIVQYNQVLGVLRRDFGDVAQDLLHDAIAAVIAIGRTLTHPVQYLIRAVRWLAMDSYRRASARERYARAYGRTATTVAPPTQFESVAAAEVVASCPPGSIGELLRQARADCQTGTTRCRIARARARLPQLADVLA